MKKLEVVLDKILEDCSENVKNAVKIFLAQEREKCAKNMAEYGTEVAKAERLDGEANIVMAALKKGVEIGRQEERAKVMEMVKGMRQHYEKGSLYDEALNNVISALSDLQVKE